MSEVCRSLSAQCVRSYCVDLICVVWIPEELYPSPSTVHVAIYIDLMLVCVRGLLRRRAAGWAGGIGPASSCGRGSQWTDKWQRGGMFLPVNGDFCAVYTRMVKLVIVGVSEVYDWYSTAKKCQWRLGCRVSVVDGSCDSLQFVFFQCG